MRLIGHADREFGSLDGEIVSVVGPDRLSLAGAWVKALAGALRSHGTELYL